MRVIALFLSLFALISCTGINGLVKRSANEEVFDTKGFQGKKRMPMYNPKYIKRAKANLISDNLDDEDEMESPYYETGELRNYHDSNRRMYDDMIEMNRIKQNLNARKRYPKLSDIDKDHKSGQDNEALKQEIKSIKKMLQETQEKMSNYKCGVRDADSLPGHKLPKAEVHTSTPLSSLVSPNCSVNVNGNTKQCR